MATAMSCLKYLLLILNFIVTILGLCLTIIGILVSVNPEILEIRSRLPLSNISPAIYLAIAVGVLLIILGLFGCCGAWFENKCMLCVYIVIMVILLILQIVVAALVFKFASDSAMKDKLDNYLKENIIEKYKNNADLAEFLNLIQHKLKCCGLTSAQDYIEKDIEVPLSCTDTSNPPDYYKKGCTEAMLSFLKDKAKIVGGVAIAAFITQTAVIVIAICLFCGIRQEVLKGIV
ncbi:23 kDa integral membrane protein-like [Centruroides sculpturatus]|uniref:23 kDa integral membrane protein-like n=1 Tax=Centruroides sculpturatus TaxID=218467 RepID=UPI000C6EA9B6|nr:23 kDa integral membrane protein-like [Centruroides sculpturatus]